MRILASLLLAVTLAVLLATPALADKRMLTEEDHVEILALAATVETAIVARDTKLLQECCDPWGGLWIDAGHSGSYNPAPVIYYGWEQIPELLDDDRLYFVGRADGTGHPVYGRASEVIWEGTWQVHGVGNDPCLGEPGEYPRSLGRIPLPEMIAKCDGREVNSLTYPPANILFPWQYDYHFVQYFFAGEDRNAEEPYDNQFWFLLFDRRMEQAGRKWCLVGIAHLDGWGI